MTPVRKLRRECFLAGKGVHQYLHASRRGLGGTVFVAGHQRSGTNMLMNVLERSLETDVYHERDARAFDDYQMRSLEVIRGLKRKSRASHFVIKALCELQDLDMLMAEFAPARTVWVYRDYRDVVNSMMRSFGGFAKQFRAIAGDRNAAGWRGRGMSDETHNIVRRIAERDIDEASAAAMQWYYRNTLFFDKGFDSNPDVMLTAYEEQVTDPDREFRRVFDFLALEFTPRVASRVFASSVRKNDPPELDAEVDSLCAGLYERIQATARTGG